MTQNISDHYLVRWLEREGGIDMEALRQDAWDSLSQNVQALVKAGSRGSVKLPSGDRVLYENGTAVTFLPKGSARPRY